MISNPQSGLRTPQPRRSFCQRFSRWLLVGVAGFALMVGAGFSSPVAAQKIKLATLSPENSPWDKMLKDMGKEWEEGTDGRVSLTIYPGGVAGDEPDILRKMKIGQYHAGALTVSGLGDVSDSFSVFEVPLFFRDFGEMEYVLETLSPKLTSSLDEKGFKLLSWGYVGWVYFFTTEKATSVDDMKKLKIFTWAGDGSMVDWWRRNGFKPVALAATDIVTGLQTGMIEAVSVPPLYAMNVQFYKQTKYMADIGLAPMMGALVITKKQYDKISDADKQVVLAAARKMEKKIFRDIPKLDDTAIKLMASQGLEVVKIKGTPAADQWVSEAEKFANDMRGDMVPTPIFDLAVQARDEYRRKAAEGDGKEAESGASQ